MYPSIHNHRCYYLLCVFIFFPLAVAGPLPTSKTFYQRFIDSLLVDKCEMPKNVQIPFPESSQLTNFSFLSSPLSECQNPEALDPESETHFLCQETFQALHYIACSKPEVPLPEIKSSLDFDHVCEEFVKMKEEIPKSKDNLSSRLVDGIVCKLLCKDKFQVMCQTLLWSYDIQAQIRKAVQNANNQDQVNDLKTDGTNVVENVPQEPVLDEPNQKKQNDANFDNIDMDQSTKTDHNNVPERNNVPKSQVNINTDNSSMAKNLSEMPKVQDLSELSNIFQSRVVMPIINHTAVNLVEDKGNLTDINAGVENNTVSVNEKSEKSVPEKDVNKKVEKVKDEDKRLEPVKAEVKNQVPVQDVERNHEAVTDAEKKVKAVKNTFNNPEKAPTTDVASEDAINAKSTISNIKDVITASEVPKKAQDNELDGANFDEELPKGASVGNALPIPGTEKDLQNPIEMAISVSEKSVDATPKSTSTTVEVLSDRNTDEDPDDREPDQDYKNSLNELKARKPVVKSSVVSEVVKPTIDLQDNYDMLLTRNNFGRGQEDTPLIASFPEQEDSHFFFYFLSIVLILMAGYLLVHNKQKIIALIIEGRHERRRRSHGAAYKKLDTK